jgi:hypothetical protein
VELVLLFGFIIEKFTTVSFFTLQIVLIVYEVLLPGRVLFACYVDHRYCLYITYLLNYLLTYSMEQSPS